MKKTLTVLAVTGAALLALGGPALADDARGPYPIPPGAAAEPSPLPGSCCGSHPPVSVGDKGEPPDRISPQPLPEVAVWPPEDDPRPWPCCGAAPAAGRAGAVSGVPPEDLVSQAR